MQVFKSLILKRLPKYEKYTRGGHQFRIEGFAMLT